MKVWHDVSAPLNPGLLPLYQEPELLFSDSGWRESERSVAQGDEKSVFQLRHLSDTPGFVYDGGGAFDPFPFKVTESP